MVAHASKGKEGGGQTGLQGVLYKLPAQLRDQVCLERLQCNTGDVYCKTFQCLAQGSYGADSQVRALQQQQLEDLVGLLHGVLPFAGLTREQLTSLAIFVRPVEVPKDQVIVKQGDPADAFYLIKSGLCYCRGTSMQNQHQLSTRCCCSVREGQVGEV